VNNIEKADYLNNKGLLDALIPLFSDCVENEYYNGIFKLLHLLNGGYAFEEETIQILNGEEKQYRYRHFIIFTNGRIGCGGLCDYTNDVSSILSAAYRKAIIEELI
jgi:hypothetical protein